MENTKEDRYKKRRDEEIKAKKQLILNEVKEWIETLPPEKREEPYLVIGTKSFTPRELVKEVENDTEIGKMVGKTLEKGRLQLSRRKR
ncbi:MAG: hypothetical protein ACFE9L_16330 [Candidatus Hodarchaeota archaeon]